MYVILGATGNIGSVLTNTLLARGEKVRVVGRDEGKLRRFAKRGAETFVGDISDAAGLTTAFTGARAAFLMIPPSTNSTDYRADQQKYSEAISAAARQSGLQYAVNLSSFGAQSATGAGPISGLHFAEKNLNAIEKLNVLHLRAAYFMENHLQGISLIQTMGLYGGAVRGDLKIPHIATRDIGSFAAERLLSLDFSGKRTRELLGERDLTMNEATAILGRGIAKPDLLYMQFPYEQVQQVLVQMGVPQKTAALYVAMFDGINKGIVAAEEPRSAENTTPTSFETFVQDVFVPAYRGQAATA
ncbi:MAG TPA: NmrA family NAD(P)-binding protein [Candidatus Saccharimonadales bacterium]|nr:NmrA family NAD(P)-binding protein [Candidatus Saccharimonadales bacterium]